MGKCKYCGKPAGFLRSKHAECEEKHRQRELVIQGGRQRIIDEALRAIKGSDNFDELEKTISEIEQSSFVPSSERKALLVKSWENSVEHFLNDGILDVTEEKRLADFKERFGLSQDELDKNGAQTKTAKAGVLRDVLNGVIPHGMVVHGNLPINLQKGEKVVWGFPGSRYLEDKTRRHYEGGSQGISVRIMKGVYYRIGAFKGYPVENTERVHIDTGNDQEHLFRWAAEEPQASLRENCFVRAIQRWHRCNARYRYRQGSDIRNGRWMVHLQLGNQSLQAIVNSMLTNHSTRTDAIKARRTIHRWQGRMMDNVTVK
jgi:hypothetical protein